MDDGSSNLQSSATAGSTTAFAAAPQNSRMKAAMSYVLLWFTGLIMLVLEPQNKLIKFHALQAIIYGLVLMIIGWIPILGWAALILGWLYALYGALLVYEGKEFRIPYITDFVEKNLM
jgi:uncharacterized membrane protein